MAQSTQLTLLSVTLFLCIHLPILSIISICNGHFPGFTKGLWTIDELEMHNRKGGSSF